jgi:hypothetical protein
MILSAMPEWKNRLPISTNIGTVTSTKARHRLTGIGGELFDADPPPMKIHAPMMLAIRKANATGTHSAISAITMPSIRADASHHSISMGL